MASPCSALMVKEIQAKHRKSGKDTGPSNDGRSDLYVICSNNASGEPQQRTSHRILQPNVLCLEPWPLSNMSIVTKIKKDDDKHVDEFKTATEDERQVVIDRHHELAHEQDSYTVDFDGITDPNNPIAWSKMRKWCTVSLLSGMMLVV